MNSIKKNKKIIILVVAIIAILLVFKVAFKSIEEKKEAEKVKLNISEILEKKQTKLIFVGSSDSKKCSKCKEVKDYLKKQGIDFVEYDVEKYSSQEYKKMLEQLEINPDDFGYPAINYINNGSLYANVINITNIKSVETFIKDYDLKTTIK